MTGPLTPQVDVEIIQALDFDATVACDHPDCSKDAAWIVHCNACHETWFLCEPHRRNLVDATSRLPSIICVRSRVAAASIDDLFEFRPVRS